MNIEELKKKATASELSLINLIETQVQKKAEYSVIMEATKFLGKRAEKLGFDERRSLQFILEDLVKHLKRNDKERGKRS